MNKRLKRNSLFFNKRNLLTFLSGIIILTFVLPSSKYFVLLPIQKVAAQKQPFLTLDKAQQIEDFRPLKELLIQQEVPFEPDILLKPNSKKLISSKLSQTPEMYEIRKLGKKIKGVQLGDILYLPEKVQLTGDTVILANKVIFEGRNPIIKGNYKILYSPLVTDGALGTTLETAMRNQETIFSEVSFTNSSRLKKFVPRLLRDNWSLTIDTSGQGRKEWLEKQKQSKQVQFSKISFQQTNDTSGGNGNTGDSVNIGNPGADAAPDPAIQGPPGSCGGQINGFSGFPGENGDTGNAPIAVAGKGGRGGDAQPQFNYPGPTGIYNFRAKGGDGGQGGKGGQGGTGGKGAQGGKGGTGANCQCEQGGRGDGGPGGPGGKGGKGGPGKKGGEGGDPGSGKNITVQLSANFTGSINHSIDGGRGGPGGDPGEPGNPGPAGSGGEGGDTASVPYVCGQGFASSGTRGPANGNLGFGEPGEFGEDRQSVSGVNGTYTQIPYTPPAEEEEDEICNQMQQTCFTQGGLWKGCNRGCFSPIVIDVAGNGFNLTNGQEGVEFDLTGDGSKDKVSWTAANSDEAWLALDRNGNGTIDSGIELFGNYTSQPSSILVQDRNGFLALAEFDRAEKGGNGDGRINNQDSIFGSLRLWQDKNHNGISEPGELNNLSSLNVAEFELNYRESKRTDEHGNRFKYRAKVKDAKGMQIGRWAWDVFLISEQP
jgi:hypothetical protein